MNTQESISQLQQFREELYHFVDHRADALMDLLDALTCTPDARSVVELSQSPLFRRGYGSISDAIAGWFQASTSDKACEERRVKEKALARLIGHYLPAPQRRPFYLFGTDVVPIPRLFAPTLKDRGFVYQPNQVRGNKPVTIGHAYSMLAHLPEKRQPDDPPWVVPMVMRRVQSSEKATVVGAEQMTMLAEDETQPFHDALCVHVIDSAYSGVEFLGRVASHKNWVNVSRAASNRVFYRQAIAQESAPPGHPAWYGTPFSLKDPTTWGTPNSTAQTTFTTKKGQTYQVRLEGWHNLLMRGKRDRPMHGYPFTLIRAVVVDKEGKPVFKRALWLIVLGERRGELSLVEAWEAYRQRYDLEHFFRFGKQRLLMASYQTPDVEHEENWLQIVQVAAVQLWLACNLVEADRRPWERYLPKRASSILPPSQVQRGLERVIRQIGTPAQPPKRRGKSPGRAQGFHPEHRQRLSVVKKQKTERKKAS